MPIDVLPRGPRRPARLVLAVVILAGLVIRPAAAQDRSTQRDQFRSAYAAAQRTPPGEWKKLAGGLDDYPLYPYLEATVLRRTIAKASRWKISGAASASNAATASPPSATSEARSRFRRR